MRNFSTYIGIDLGGARGKTTAVAVLRPDRGQGDGPRAWVASAASRHDGGAWTDDVLLQFIVDQPNPVVAVNAPLTMPACLRCQLPACPGVAACVDPAVIWLRSKGAGLERAVAEDDGRRVAWPEVSGQTSGVADPGSPNPGRLAPYTHRCTEVALHYKRGLLPREYLGQAVGPLSARGHHLRKVLKGRNFELGNNLIEVAPRATVQALFGPDKARGYKRDADPWVTRAGIVEGLSESLSFAPESRMSREEVLQNDHCFDALLSAYSAFLFCRDGWAAPNGQPWAEDGWIFAPEADGR